jgi:hypothetical protein
MREHVKDISHVSKFHYEYFKKFNSSDGVIFCPWIDYLLNDNWKLTVILELSIRATLTFGCRRLVTTSIEECRVTAGRWNSGF